MGEIKVLKGKLTIRDGNKVIKEIEIPEGEVIKFWEEKEPDDWHRKRFDRNKDGLVHPQIAQDIDRIAKSVAHVNDDGKYISKYDIWLSTLSPKPKTLQKKGNKRQTQLRNLYKEYFSKEFEKGKKDLDRFKGMKLFLYLCFYLRKKKYETTDLDNYPKIILDALKPYVGDDSQITTLLLDKKLIYGDYHKEDLDFIENTLIVVAEEKAKQDLLKAI